MKFGVFYNPMVPKRADADDWDPDQERQALLDTIEQIRFADSLGFDYAFLGEHHFMAEYAHNSATEVLMGALTQATRDIRLGTGIVHTSHNDPVRVAERIATMDQISGGRIEFGFGAGSEAEVRPLLGDAAGQRRQRSDAAGKIAADILASRGTWPGVHNAYFSYPPVDVVPKAYQRPHPPLWTSTATPGMAQGVARRGLGMLMLTIGGAEVVAAEVDAYWEALRTGPVTPVGVGVNPAVFTFATGLVAPTDALAQERGREGVEFFGYGLSGAATARIGDPSHHLYRSFLDFKAGRGDIRDQDAPPLLLQMGAHMADAPGNMLCGVDKARELTRQIADARADGMLINMKFGWTKHEHQMESLELWAKQIIPEFRESHARHQEWRARQLKDFPHPLATSV